MMDAANLFVLFLGAWFGVGAIVALLFLLLGVSKVDAAAKGASLFFRPTIFLGCAMLWPYVIIRWMSGVKINEPDEDVS